MTRPRISIHQLGPDLWQLRYAEPGTGRDVRRRLRGTEREAQAAALMLERSLTAKTDPINNAPELSEGYRLAMKTSRAGRETMSARDNCWMLFHDWLSSRHPSITTWAEMQPIVLREYQIELERTLAPNTVRLRLEPIRFAWRSMAENHPRVVIAPPRVRLLQKPRVAGPQINAWNPEQLGKVLLWVQANRPSAWPYVALTGLAGLRVREAFLLAPDNVKDGLLTIGKTTCGDAPKNNWSWRVIPLAKPVADAAAGLPWTNPHTEHTAWRRAISSACRAVNVSRAADGYHRGGTLRAAFATLAGSLGVDDRVLKAYMGHAPGDVLGSHYRAISLKEMQEVSLAVAKWWNNIGNK